MDLQRFAEEKSLLQQQRKRTTHHKNIFNNCTQEGNIGINHIAIPEKLIEQYEQRIQSLESEVLFLRTLVK